MSTRLISSVTLLGLVALAGTPGIAQEQSTTPGGELHILAPDGKPVGVCPLQHTDVQADIIGYVGRVRVRQTFYNPLDEKIEAVYVFPLPEDSAVDDMIMTIGDRRIVGIIKARDEARRIYETAKRAGYVAGLLDQERPNIFTQSVANIEPGVQVVIEISYVQTLPYDEGVFEFVFPMVVGPRYMPGSPTGKKGTGWSADTSQVPDASRISPPVAPPGTRAGHDISLTVHLDAGMELLDLRSVLHEVTTNRQGGGRATITLANRTEIPNKDFILRYRTATDSIGDAFLVHTDQRGSYFTLVLQPPRRVLPEEAMPKEMIFVIDRSGSMSGFPIEKAKETMRLCIQQMNPNDTFNLLSFSGGTGRCFNRPVPNTPQNREKALRYLQGLHGSGGTEMMKAIRAALGGPDDPERVRIVCFMTDGYIGNDFAIIDAVKKNAGTARVFSFGIGNSVNRFLLDGMAHAGRGEVEYVTLRSQGEGAAGRFHQRIHSPVLTDIQIDWGSLSVADVYPKTSPDLFSSKPIMIHGRLVGTPSGAIILRGNTGSGPFQRVIEVSPDAGSSHHDALASLWARAKVKDLMMQDYAGLQNGNLPEDLRSQIIALGIEYRLMTQFTSFVAVDESAVTAGGDPTTVAVPVDMPDGVSYEGVFGGVGGQVFAQSTSHYAPAKCGRGAGLRFANVSSAIAPASSASPRAENAVTEMAVDRLERELGDASAFRTESDEDRRDVSARKLSAELRDLADKVTSNGKDGNLTIGKLRVVAFTVEVMIHLGDMSAETIKALKELGFVQKAQRQSDRVVIGTIDVRKLTALAKLAAVIRIDPAPGW